MPEKPPSASAFAPTTGSAAASATLHDGVSSGTADSANALTTVRRTYTYQVRDKDAPGGKRDVERDELDKGYEYGRTTVDISKSDEGISKMVTKAGLEFIGFIPSANVWPAQFHTRFWIILVNPI